MCTEAPAERVLRHMEFMCQLYRVQIEQGGYILHEDPASVHSWTSKCVNDLLNKPRVTAAMSPVCAFKTTARRDLRR